MSVPLIPFSFVRHGQTDSNAKRLIVGSELDVPLNDFGRMQAHDLKTTISRIEPQAVCYSPMRRAQETMEIATQGLNVDRIEIPELGECSANVWLQMTSGEMDNEVEIFLERVVRGVGKALMFGTPVLVFGHGGTHFALCHLCNIKEHPWKINNCDVVYFEPRKQNWEARLLP